MMKVVLVFAAITLVALAVEDAAGVKELDDAALGEEGAPTMDNGGDSTHPAYTATNKYMEGPGYFKSIPNFVGPKYGLPGYKESHNWVEDFDMMSPLTFDYRFYRALILAEPSEAKAMTEEDLKTHFTSQVNQKEHPNCPQGTIWFNANEFYNMHSNHKEFDMGGKGCKDIVRMFMTKGLFEGWALSKHKNGGGSFATIGSKLFNPDNTYYDTKDANSEAEASGAYYQVQSGSYVPTPVPDGDRGDNTFSPARHMSIVFWLKFGTFDEAPNAELFAYGGDPGDNYFRTGVGCLSTDIAAEECNCYFIFVMQAKVTEYFHTYNTDNFETLRDGFQGGLWAHVLMMLSTHKPGGFKDPVSVGCPNNDEPSPGDCSAILELYVNKEQLKIVDWSDGKDWHRTGGWPVEASDDPTVIPPPVNWGQRIRDVWSTAKPDDPEGTYFLRRFWLSPPQDCRVAPTSLEVKENQCGMIMNNGLIWAFPWFGAYMAGVWVCDFTTIPSGAGGFGEKERREIARDAFFDTMAETVGIACNHEDPGTVAVNSHAKHRGNLKKKSADGGR